MATDMYHNSIDGVANGMIPAAESLLMKGELIGFVQACGPYYVHSIRRTKSIIVLFQVRVSTDTDSELLSSSIESIIGSFDTPSGDQNVGNELDVKIDIFGFGLGLTVEARNGRLLARNLEEFEQAMNYGFQAMKDIRAGLVKSIEVIPWTAHIGFQLLSTLDVPMLEEECRTLTNRLCTGRRCAVSGQPVDCQNSCYVSGVTVDCRDGNSCAATNYCDDSDGNPISFGYLGNFTLVPCLDDEIYGTFATESGDLFSEDVTDDVVDCPDDSEPYSRSTVEFPSTLKQFNFVANAELLATLDAIVSDQFIQIEKLQQCISVLRSMNSQALSQVWVRNQFDPPTRATEELSRSLNSIENPIPSEN